MTNAMEQVGTIIGITAGIFGIIALVVYIWADRKDEKEIDALLKKNGIDTKKTRT